jgi:carboxyl-terminal processing protease
MILKERGVAYVMAVDEGSPAERAGIEVSQVVSKLQGRSTRGMPRWRIQQLLGSPVGTRLELELLDSGDRYSAGFEVVEFAAPRPHIRTVRDVPVLRIPAFSEQTPADVDRLLLEAGEKSLIVDLRGVAGGDPEAAYGVAERFAAGELGTLAGRHGALRHFAGPVPPIWSGPLAVLVSRGTQGAAEVLATVLRQACGARLVGERTFGHAGKTESIGLSSGALLELTGAFYTGPDAKPLNGSLEPDLWIRPGSTLTAGEETDQPERDEALEQAIDLLLQADG